MYAAPRSTKCEKTSQMSNVADFTIPRDEFEQSRLVRSCLGRTSKCPTIRLLDYGRRAASTPLSSSMRLGALSASWFPPCHDAHARRDRPACVRDDRDAHPALLSVLLCLGVHAGRDRPACGQDDHGADQAFLAASLCSLFKDRQNACRAYHPFGRRVLFGFSLRRIGISTSSGR